MTPSPPAKEALSGSRRFSRLLPFFGFLGPLLFFALLHFHSFHKNSQTLSIASQVLKIPADEHPSPDSLLASPYREQFSPMKTLSVGFTRDQVWLLATVTNHGNRTHRGYLSLPFTHLRSITFFPVQGSKLGKGIQRGTLYPPEPGIREARIPLTIDAKGTSRVLIGIRSETPIVLALIATTEAEEWERQLFETGALAAALGVMTIMAVFNGLVYLGLRDRCYLYLSLYSFLAVLWYLLTQGWILVAFGPQPWLYPYETLIPSLSAWFLVRFFSLALNAPTLLPILDRCLRWGTTASLVVILATCLLSIPELAGQILALTAISIGVVTLVGAFAIWHLGYGPARLWFLGQGFFIGGIFAYALTVIGPALSIPYSFLGANGSLFGQLAEIALFAFALVERVTLLREEKNAAEREHQAREEQRLRDLDQLVAERTESLRRQGEMVAAVNEMSSRLQGCPSLDHALALARDALPGILPNLWGRLELPARAPIAWGSPSAGDGSGNDIALRLADTGGALVLSCAGKWEQSTLDLAEMAAEQIGLTLRNLALRSDLARLADHDGLTGLLNRRAIENCLETTLADVAARGAPLALLMLDLDHFKKINDGMGHQTGDLLLSTLGAALQENLPANARSGRYGGEEFLVLLPDISAEQALNKADALRRKIEKLEVLGPNGTLIPATASLGLALFPDHGDTAHDLLGAADRALYEAKDRGRNQVMIARA